MILGRVPADGSPHKISLTDHYPSSDRGANSPLPRPTSTPGNPGENQATDFPGVPGVQEVVGDGVYLGSGGEDVVDGQDLLPGEVSVQV
ncbi:hypothetical protein GCM10010388_74870 [Streptomyces mauvecolor]